MQQVQLVHTFIHPKTRHIGWEGAEATLISQSIGLVQHILWANNIYNGTEYSERQFLTAFYCTLSLGIQWKTGFDLFAGPLHG